METDLDEAVRKAEPREEATPKTFAMEIEQVMERHDEAIDENPEECAAILVDELAAVCGSEQKKIEAIKGSGDGFNMMWSTELSEPAFIRIGGSDGYVSALWSDGDSNALMKAQKLGHIPQPIYETVVKYANKNLEIGDE